MQKLYVFGPPRVVLDDGVVKIGRRKALALLAYLAINDQRHSRDHLSTLLWPDTETDRARAALRRAMAAIKSALGTDPFDADREMIGLSADFDLWIDARAFEDLISRGPGDIAALSEAVSLYSGDFMQSFTLRDSPEYDRWQYYEGERLRRELGEGLRALVDRHEQAGTLEEAILYARQWLHTDPLDEEVNRRLMRLYAGAGKRDEAIHQYEVCMRLLHDELGITPEPETVALYEAIASNRKLETAMTEQAIPGSLPRLPTLVIGRADALSDVKKLIISDAAERHPVIVIQGWPGLGKTTLAALLAHDRDLAQAFPDGILWASVGEQPDLMGILQSWGRALGVGHVHDSLDEAAAQITTLLRDRKVLLLYDDIWDIPHATRLQVGGAHCTAVYTTRHNDVAAALAASPDAIYKLARLSDNDALSLLSALAPGTIEAYPDESEALVRDLEGLPLAIQVAGRMLQIEAQMDWGVEDLLRDLREGTRLLGADAPADIALLDDETTPTVAVLLRKSTDRLDGATREQFALLGAFAPKPATFDLPAMQAVWDVIDPKPTVRALVNRGLLEPAGGGRFQMHALLVAHARSMFERV